MRELLSAALFCSFNRGQFVVRVTTDLIDEITPDSASTPYIFLLSSFSPFDYDGRDARFRSWWNETSDERNHISFEVVHRRLPIAPTCHFEYSP